MALKTIEVSHPFSIEGRDGFDGITFSGSSDDYLVWPKAVVFGGKNNGILQSTREAGAFSIEAEGKDDAYLYQATRTGVVYFKAGDKFYAAIDDTVDPAQNIVVARAEDGYKARSKNNKFILPVSDTLVRGVLSRAEKAGRIVEVVAESPLELKTKSVDGKSEFGQNDWNKAILVDVSEPYAQMLNKRGYNIGRVWSLTPKDLEQKGVDGNNVEVRPVGLGGVGIDGVGVGFNCGCARGVRGAREISTGNEGRIVQLPDKQIYEIVSKMCA
jgi:hypothetical protein